MKLPPATSLTIAALCATPLFASDPAEIIFAAEQFAEQHSRATAETIFNTLIPAGSTNLFPFETVNNGEWRFAAWSSWPAGFFAGIAWHFANTTGDEDWLDWAQQLNQRLSGWPTRQQDHDIGFNVLTSFAESYRLLGRSEDRTAIVTAAENFSSVHWMPAVGSLWSFNFNNRGPNGRVEPAGSERVVGPIRARQNVIIDTSMNIELLFLGARKGGDPELWQRGLSHMQNVVRDMVRPDGGTIQVVDYWLTDQFDGEGELLFAAGSKRGAYAWQGYTHESTWSRGQGWVIHGLASAFRETGDPILKEGLLRTADFYLRNTPEDGVPYWDFDAADIEDAVYLEFYQNRGADLLARDSSAAAITAAGLLQMVRLIDDETLRQRYFDFAERILVSLSTPEADGGYLAQGTDFASILTQGTYTFDGTHKGLAWGDFYFIQALQRYRELVAPPSMLSSDAVAGLHRHWWFDEPHRWAVRMQAGRLAFGLDHGIFPTRSNQRPGAIAVLDAEQESFDFSIDLIDNDNPAFRTDSEAVLVFNYRDTDNFAYLTIGRTDRGVALHSVRDGIVNTLVQTQPGGLLLSADWQRFTMRVSGNDLQLFRNDQLLLSHSSVDWGGSGRIGVGSMAHSVFFANPRLEALQGPKPLTFDDWIALQSHWPEQQRGPLHDASGNGIANILEFALGDSVSANGWQDTLQLQYSAVDGIQISHPIRLNTDVSLALEYSNDLIFWAPIEIIPGSTQQTLTIGSTARAQWHIPPGFETAPIFFRIAVSSITE